MYIFKKISSVCGSDSRLQALKMFPPWVDLVEVNPRAEQGEVQVHLLDLGEKSTWAAAELSSSLHRAGVTPTPPQTSWYKRTSEGRLDGESWRDSSRQHGDFPPVRPSPAERRRSFALTSRQIHVIRRHRGGATRRRWPWGVSLEEWLTP